jgi:hypothetical protein
MPGSTSNSVECQYPLCLVTICSGLFMSGSVEELGSCPSCIVNCMSQICVSAFDAAFCTRTGSAGFNLLKLYDFWMQELAAL